MEVVMKLLVCIKQVPDLESRFKVNSSGTWFAETDLAFRMNEYDEYAVEEAVKLREAQGDGCELVVLSIGPDRVGEAIKKALAMGADRAVHVQDTEVATKDPWQIASIIAGHAKSENYDIIFTGMQSQDRGSAQVGVLVSEMLGYSCATTLIGFSYEGGTVTAKRELEGGLKGVARLATPAVVTCQLGLNIPRYPTLPNIMKAKKKEIAQIAVSDLLKDEAVTTTTSFHPPAKKGGGIVLEGDVNELVDKVIGILKEKTAVLR
jgi:electron transfer flavoprotein beta subunit